jgi:hypothetical protein
LPGIADLAVAVAGYVDWSHHWHLHGDIGDDPPVECEDAQEA